MSLATDGHDPAPVAHAADVSSATAWPTAGERVHEEDSRFDCRVDGDQHCGPNALVPVPDGRGGIAHVPLSLAPWPPVWRAY